MLATDVLVPSQDVVVRIIAGELVIVPIAAGIGDMDDELYTLNDTARAIWERLDGTRDLASVAAELAGEYSADASLVERDVLGLASELAGRNMLVAASRA